MQYISLHFNERKKRKKNHCEKNSLKVTGFSVTEFSVTEFVVLVFTYYRFEAAVQRSLEALKTFLKNFLVKGGPRKQDRNFRVI